MKKFGQNPRKVRPPSPENAPPYRGYKSIEAFIEPWVEALPPLRGGGLLHSSRGWSIKTETEAHAPPGGGDKSRKAAETMRVQEVQDGFLAELFRDGIDRLDLGLARGPNRKFQLKGLEDLTVDAVRKRLPWLRAENKAGADIYFRPSSEGVWPLIFLDDLTHPQIGGIAKKYQAWIIETSPGLHHAWIRTDHPLSKPERYAEQSRIVSLGVGDPGSVSGDHFGRLPGFKNWKRGGVWVNLKSSPDLARTCLHPLGGRVLHPEASEPAGTRPELRSYFPGRGRGEGGDSSESGREFGWCCGWIRAGRSPEEAIRRLAIRAEERGKNSPGEYARRTVHSACFVIGGPPFRVQIEGLPVIQADP